MERNQVTLSHEFCQMFSQEPSPSSISFIKNKRFSTVSPLLIHPPCSGITLLWCLVARWPNIRAPSCLFPYPPRQDQLSQHVFSPCWEEEKKKKIQLFINRPPVWRRSIYNEGSGLEIPRTLDLYKQTV